MAKKIFRTLLIVLLLLFVLFGAFIFALRYPTVQTYLAQKATAFLSNKLGTKVSVDKLRITFWTDLELDNFYMADGNGDTLIAAHLLTVDFKTVKLLDKEFMLEGITLDGATVHLERDSAGQTNIGKLLAKLKSENAKPTKPGKFDLKIDLDNARITHTDFRWLDYKEHLDIHANLPSLLVDLNQLALDKGAIDIKSVTVADADVRFNLMKRVKTPSDTSKPIHFLPAGISVRWDGIEFTNAHFALNDANVDTIAARGIDFNHLDLANIHLRSGKGSVVADTILADIQALEAKERCGLSIAELQAQVRVSVSEITLAKLLLKTPNSVVRDFFSMKFHCFHDLKKFLTDVRLDANLENTNIALSDLDYFIKKLDKVAHNRVRISGNIKGTVSNLRGKNISLATGNSTVFNGDFSTSGLPNIFETFISLRVRQLTTDLNEVQRIYPGLKLPPNVYSIGRVNFSGSLDGFVTDLVANGKLNTALGSASSDLNFKYNNMTKKAAYSGFLALKNFDLGRFFNDEKNLGKVSLSAKVNGGGLTLETLNVAVDGEVQSITLRNYEYTDLKVDGVVKSKSFQGRMSINDEHLDMDFEGFADISKEVPEFSFASVIRKAELKALNLLPDDIRFSGKLNADFKGKKIDDLVGSVFMNDITVQRDDRSVYVKNIMLNSTILSPTEKVLLLKSEVAEAEVRGNFLFSKLPQALKTFALRTLQTNYVDSNATSYPQSFTFKIDVKDPKELTQVLLPKLKVVRDTKVSGNFDNRTHTFNYEASIPELVYDNFRIQRFTSTLMNSGDEILFSAAVDRAYMNDSLLLDTISLRAQNDGSNYRFDVLLADSKKFNTASLSAILTPLKGKSSVRLLPGEVKLGNNFWSFAPDNVIEIEGKKIVSRGVTFKTADEAIFIDSYLKGDTSTSIKLTLSQTSIGDFTGIFSQKMSDLKGMMNGYAYVEDVFAKPKVHGNIIVDNFTLGDQLVGDVDAEVILSEDSRRVFVITSVKSLYNNIDADGYVSIDPKEPGMHVNINAKRIGTNFLNYKYFTRYVKNVNGWASARLTVSGVPRKPILTGDVLIDNGDVTVSYLNTRYKLRNQRVTLDENGFDFGKVKATDVNGNLVFGTGRINHQSFKNFALDLNVYTDNGQLLNTTVKDNPIFYGVAFGKASITFSGSIKTPVIKAYATTKPGTWCRLPINSSYETNRYTFYKFIPKTTDTVKVVKRDDVVLRGVTFILELDVTPDATVEIILDPAAGDRLIGQGRGNLRIEIQKTGDINMYGTYEIEQGEYLFTLQNIINKRFAINKGGTINFSGSIYKAKLNVDAVYAVRTSMYDLIEDLIIGQNTDQGSASSSSSQIVSTAKNRIPVDLLLKLTGVLESPTVAFDIRPLNPDPAIKSYVEQKLNLVKRNDVELNKQVFGLLVMNRFLPSSTSTTSAIGNTSSLGGTAANTVSEFLTSQFSLYASDLLSTLIQNKNVDIDLALGYRQYDELTETAQNQQLYDTRRELQLALTQRFFNNRLTVNASGNFDFGSSTTNDQGTGSRSVIPTGDFQIEYALTKDGSWRARAFNRTNYDYFNARNNNRTGIGISYRQEFDKPKDLFDEWKRKSAERKMRRAEKKAKKVEKVN